MAGKIIFCRPDKVEKMVYGDKGPNSRPIARRGSQFDYRVIGTMSNLKGVESSVC